MFSTFTHIIYSMRIFFLSLAAFFISLNLSAQFNIGFLSGGDLYQRQVNPIDFSGGLDRSAGSAIMNSNLGLKVLAGTPKFSFSVESYANFGALALNIEEYKGLGSLVVPVLAKLNFNGLSGLGLDENEFGWSIGGGYQWSRTEWYGLSTAAREAGAQRNFFENYVVELGFGTGSKSKFQEYFIRFGLDPNVKSNVFHFGVNTTYSIPYFKMPKFNFTPESGEEEEIIKI